MVKVNEKSIQDIPILEVVKEENMELPLLLVIFYHGWRSNKELVTLSGS